MYADGSGDDQPQTEAGENISIVGLAGHKYLSLVFHGVEWTSTSIYGPTLLNRESKIPINNLELLLCELHYGPWTNLIKRYIINYLLCYRQFDSFDTDVELLNRIQHQN